jgi:hypothetical protein
MLASSSFEEEAIFSPRGLRAALLRTALLLLAALLLLTALLLLAALLLPIESSQAVVDLLGSVIDGNMDQLSDEDARESEEYDDGD